MYKALIAPVVNVRAHPNAERVKLATVSGYQVVVGLETKERTLGVFFPTDGKLSNKMLYANNLYRNVEKNIIPEAKPGFFEDNGRVRVQKFRGENSDGFWVPLEHLAWTGYDLSKLKEGDEIDILNGERICEKYYTPATRQAMAGKQGKQSKKGPRIKDLYPTFKEHYDTAKLRHAIGTIPNDQRAIITITEKCHGTSGRTGRLLEKNKPNWWQRLLRVEPRKEYKYISGTRRVVMDPNKVHNGYHKGEFRSNIHDFFKEVGLHQGETVYYEIVGFEAPGRPIMPPHGIKDEKLKKRYGSRMVYKYGCEEGARILVYRITMTNDQGHSVDLPWHQVVRRCNELGAEAVPLLMGPFVLENREQLFEICRLLADGNSTLDHEHIREGVVVKVEHPDKEGCYKYKGYWFCALEDIAKNSDTYVDPEEIT